MPDKFIALLKKMMRFDIQLQECLLCYVCVYAFLLHLLCFDTC